MRRGEATWTSLGMTFLGMAAAAFAATAERRISLVYNPSASAPRGWYSVRRATSLRTGVIVLVRLPAAARRLADTRRYLPESVPALKVIVAGPGDRVCEAHGRVIVDGRTLAFARSHDAAGRQLIAWSGCLTLASGQFFLVNTDNSASFDSRYFGPVGRSQIFGTATPLWTWR